MEGQVGRGLTNTNNVWKTLMETYYFVFYKLHMYAYML